MPRVCALTFGEVHAALRGMSVTMKAHREGTPEEIRLPHAHPTRRSSLDVIQAECTSAWNDRSRTDNPGLTVIIVDGYNLLHALKKRFYDMPREFLAARARTLDLLEAYALGKEARVLVFLDGTPGQGPDNDAARPHIRLIYTGGEADGEICQYVRHAVLRADVTVVSSDREVSDECRLHGAGTIKSEVMAKRLEPYLKLQLSGANAGAYRRKDAVVAPRLNQPVAASATPAPASAKPRLSDGALADYEREMLQMVEDFDDLARDALDAPLPAVRQPEEPPRGPVERRDKGRRR